MFRQVARPTEKFDIDWQPPFEAYSLSEDKAKETGEFLLRVGHPLRAECSHTIKGATYYVTRLFDYHRNDANFRLSLKCSTVVCDQSIGQIIGVCMVGGGGTDGQEFGIYDIIVDPASRRRRIGTNMILRAMSILAEHNIAEFHLWRNDDSPTAGLYEKLGFLPTGKVE